MRLLPLLILLGFPALELYVMAAVAHEIGWWLCVWLAVSALVGAALVREAGIGLSSRLVNALRNGGSVLYGMADTGRTLLAGLFFIFPGILSDIVAIGLLLLPFRVPLTSTASSGGDGVIDGEFRRIDRNHS